MIIFLNNILLFIFSASFLQQDEKLYPHLEAQNPHLEAQKVSKTGFTDF